MSSYDYEVICLSEAISPISHAQGTSGNYSLIAREPVVTPRGVTYVPNLSGNAIRHRAVRETGFRWLIGEYGLRGRLTLQQLNFLLHGGNLTEGGGRENTRRIADFQRLFPLGRLLGGCLPDQVLAGSIQCWRGTLVCEENRPALAPVIGAHLPERQLRPAESFVSNYQYTRSDAVKSAPDLQPLRGSWRIEGVGVEAYKACALALEAKLGRPWHAGMSDVPRDERARWHILTVSIDRREADEIATAAGTNIAEHDSQLMIFSGQSVLSGAIFLHGFTLPHCSELELGALLWSLQLWQAQGGTIGGQASRGHGRLKTSLLAADWDGEAAVDAYLDHARAAKDEAVAWLNDVFAPRAARPEGAPAPAPRGRKRSATASSEQAPSLPMEDAADG